MPFMYPVVVGTTFQVSYLYYIRLSGFLLTRHSLDEDDTFFLFLLYASDPSKTRDDTTKVKVTLDYSRKINVFIISSGSGTIRTYTLERSNRRNLLW